MPEKRDFVISYQELAKNYKNLYDESKAMSAGVGGSFEAIGILERELLIQHGLQANNYLIDIGCSSGRLAKPLSEYLLGKYLGTDVVPDFITYARQIVEQKDWRFEVTDGIKIPELDGQADMVCFFSVLTHLFYEQSYRYLLEAKRVLKPQGTIIFSFLEFQIPDRWIIFESTLSEAYAISSPPIMFIGRDAIQAWANHLDLEIIKIIDGNRPHIPLSHPIQFDDGTVVEGRAKLGPIGQSVCILRKT